MTKRQKQTPKQRQGNSLVVVQVEYIRVSNVKVRPEKALDILVSSCKEGRKNEANKALTATPELCKPILKKKDESKNNDYRSSLRPAETENRLCFTVPEVAKMLGISRNYAYELVRQGVIPSTKFGNVIRISRIALENMLEKGGVL